MKSYRMLAMLIVTLSFLLFSSGCVGSFWAVDAIRYTKTGELYDDRDPSIVRRPFVLGRAFLVVEVDLTYFGDESHPNADIRQDLEFRITPPGTGNIYEDESWDFYDAIEPIFTTGDSRVGSIYFEIPDVSVYDWRLRITAFEDCQMCFQSWLVLDKKLGELDWVSGYPDLW